MSDVAYMVREDWARDIALADNSRPIHAWIAERPHLVVVHEHPSQRRERAADVEAIRFISPASSRIDVINMAELRELAANQPIARPVVLVHPAEGRDSDDAIRRMLVEGRLGDTFALLWSPAHRLRLWLDATGACNLATGTRLAPPDAVLREACSTIQNEEYNGLDGGRGKDVTIHAIRALAAEGYPLDDAAWGRAILSAGASLEAAEVVMRFVREIRDGRQHRVQTRLRPDIARVWRERALNGNGD